MVDWHGVSSPRNTPTAPAKSKMYSNVVDLHLKKYKLAVVIKNTNTQLLKEKNY